MEELCKRCLLYEAGGRAAYTQVQAYLETVPPEELASPTVPEQSPKPMLSLRPADRRYVSQMRLLCGGTRSTERQYLPPYRGAECGDERRLERIQVGFFYGLIV